MIDIKRTFYTWSDTCPVAVGETVGEEGQGLIAVLENGVEKVKPAAGLAVTEKVVGFAQFRQLSFSTSAVVEDHVCPSASPYTIELSKQHLIENQVRVTLLDGTPVTLAQGAVDKDHGIITLAAGQASKTVRVYFRYEMTVAEVKQTYYEAPINHPDPNFFEQVGVGKGKGRIYTMFYDQAIDWSADTVVPALAAKGLISDQHTTATLPAIPNGRVVNVPSPTDPYLGIEFLV